jgi:hypothetical protein
MMPNVTGRAVDTGVPAIGTVDPIIGRLRTEFVGLSHTIVERCVADVWACAAHLGLTVTPGQVERVAREHLMGVVKSEPPSGRPF